MFMEEIAKLIRNLDNEELKQIKCLADVQIARYGLSLPHSAPQPRENTQVPEQ